MNGDVGRDRGWDAALEGVPVGVVRTDREWVVCGANRAARELLGTGGESWDGVLLGNALADGAAVVERLRAAVAASGGGRGIVSGARLARADRRVEVDLFAQSGADGGGWMVALVDASARGALAQELERLQRALAESEKARAKLGEIQRELSEAASAPPRIIGRSAPVLRMLDQVDKVAPTPATVLIHGESGSGKELVARAIHAGSPRSRHTMVAVNCASLPETLIESELFGHERGAFTGADRQRLGKFELADGGSLFLDEIAELSPAAQAKLLRVLQEGTLERVGGTETIQVDVRLIAATHRDLAQQVERGRFREDLFYRLNVFKIEVPALRERTEDIRELAEHFHEMHAKRMARAVVPISDRSMRLMLSYRWPGNVRELENTIERATLMESGPELEIELPESPMPGGGSAVGGAMSAGRGSRDTSQVPRDVLLDLSIDQLQRLQIMHALETSSYKVFGAGAAAEKLAINPQTLLSRMDKLGIPRPRTMRRALRGEGEGSG